MAGIEFKSLGVGTPAKVLLLPQGAMADTPEVGVPRGFAKDDSDEGEGDDEGPAVVKTVSARSRTGAVVVCPPGLVEDEASDKGVCGGLSERWLAGGPEGLRSGGARLRDRLMLQQRSILPLPPSPL